MKTFYVGAKEACWLDRTDQPLFMSRRTLTRMKHLPRARGRWALDSGGFTEVTKNGGWELSSKDYAREVRRYRDEIGGMDWASIQDWMCEPIALQATGLSVKAHQLLTIQNYLELMHHAPDIPWVPVIQGWQWHEYREHLELWLNSGIDLENAPVVGVGSVCRRSGKLAANIWLADFLHDLHCLSIPVHTFGLSRLALRNPYVVDRIVSSDSMAWSMRARYGGEPGDRNSLEYALKWREETLSLVDRVRLGKEPVMPKQLGLFDPKPEDDPLVRARRWAAADPNEPVGDSDPEGYKAAFPMYRCHGPDCTRYRIRGVGGWIMYIHPVRYSGDKYVCSRSCYVERFIHERGEDGARASIPDNWFRDDEDTGGDEDGYESSSVGEVSAVEHRSGQ